MVNRLILVDTSYTSFYRFFATIRWFSFAEKDMWKMVKDDKDYDWSLNKTFIEKYKKLYLESIIKLIGKKNFKKSMIIFCLDSKQTTLWRNKIMKEYKGSRTDLSKKRNFKTTFSITYKKLIPSIVKNNENIYSIKVGTTEADDIIAVITNYFKTKNPELPIDIISGDEDFKQLGRTNVTFYDYRKKKKAIKLTVEEAKQNLNKKIIYGDNSDNIKCIFTKEMKISNKLKKEIISDKDKLNEFLQNNKEASNNYNINKKMIDFDEIPKNITEKIMKKSKKILNIII